MLTDPEKIADAKLEALRLAEQLVYNDPVCALRAAAAVERALAGTPLTDDRAALTRAVEVKLRRVSPGFMAVKSIDAEKGTGVYEERVDGKTVMSKFTFELDGSTVVLKTAEDCTPENPYTDGLATLRAASATELSAFEDRWKAERLATLTAEAAEVAQEFASNPPRLTAAEEADLAAYAAPDPYREGISRMQQEMK